MTEQRERNQPRPEFFKLLTSTLKDQLLSGYKDMTSISVQEYVRLLRLFERKDLLTSKEETDILRRSGVMGQLTQAMQTDERYQCMIDESIRAGVQRSRQSFPYTPTIRVFHPDVFHFFVFFDTRTPQGVITSDCATYLLKPSQAPFPQTGAQREIMTFEGRNNPESPSQQSLCVTDLQKVQTLRTMIDRPPRPTLVMNHSQ